MYHIFSYSYRCSVPWFLCGQLYKPARAASSYGASLPVMQVTHVCLSICNTRTSTYSCTQQLVHTPSYSLGIGREVCSAPWFLVKIEVHAHKVHSIQKSCINFNKLV